MTTSAGVIATLKRELKRRGITYRTLAGQLGLSESAVKHMFASGSFSLKRLDELCAVLELDLSDIVNIAADREARIEELPPELERELVSDIRLLCVAYCLVSYWSVDEILAKYAFSETEIVQLLARLDRMKLIELQPGNRVRLLISKNFRWQENGAIESFFRNQAQTEFLGGDFSGTGAVKIVKNANLSKKSQSIIADRLTTIGDLFDDAIADERRLPAAQQDGTTMVLAIRTWSFEGFRKLERASP